MYRSRAYLEIAGKLVACPYEEDDILYGVNLHDLMCQLHISDVSSRADFFSVIFSAIKYGSDLTDIEKITEIFNLIMNDLQQQGVTPHQAH